MKCRLPDTMSGTGQIFISGAEYILAEYIYALNKTLNGNISHAIKVGGKSG